MSGWLHTEMVYPPVDDHQSNNSPGPALINFVDATNDDTRPPPLETVSFFAIFNQNIDNYKPI